MAPRYRVTLTKEEREELEDISSKGKRAARTILHARALLLLDAGEYGQKWTIVKVAEALAQLCHRFLKNPHVSAISAASEKITCTTSSIC